MKTQKFNNLIAEIKSKVCPFLYKLKNIKKRNLYIIIATFFLLFVYIIFAKESIFVDKNIIRRENVGGNAKNYSIYFSNGKDVIKEPIDFTIEPKKMSTEEAERYFDKLYEEILPGILGTNANFQMIHSDLKLSKVYKNDISAVWNFKLKEEKDTDFIQKYQNLIESNGKVNNENFKDSEEIEGYLTTEFSVYVNDKDTKLKSSKYMTEVKVIKKKQRKAKN